MLHLNDIELHQIFYSLFHLNASDYFIILFVFNLVAWLELGQKFQCKKILLLNLETKLIYLFSL